MQSGAHFLRWYLQAAQAWVVLLPVLEILLIFVLFAIVVLEMTREFGCVAGGAGAVFLFRNGFSLLFRSAAAFRSFLFSLPTNQGSLSWRTERKTRRETNTYDDDDDI
jgi:hypothetical protein